MEPGERHREHTPPSLRSRASSVTPQWSPVNVTGNTRRRMEGDRLVTTRRNGAR